VLFVYLFGAIVEPLNQKENNVTQCLNGIISNASVCSNVTSLNASKIELDPVTEFWE
jgi:lipopolysaccharide assembly outer membrane protein LptD (OstA)